MPRATRRSSATRQRTAPSCRPRRIARINLHGSASARCDGPNRSDTRNTSCRCTGSCRTGGHSALIGGARRVVLPHPRQPAPLLSLLVCLYGSAKILAPKREEPRCVVRFDCWCPDRIVIGGSPDSEYLPSPPPRNRTGMAYQSHSCNAIPSRWRRRPKSRFRSESNHSGTGICTLQVSSASAMAFTSSQKSFTTAFSS